MTEVLFIRIDKPLKDELARISETLGLSKSELVRVGILLIPEISGPNEVERIMAKLTAEVDAWYVKHKGSGNNGGDQLEDQESITEEPET